MTAFLLDANMSPDTSHLLRTTYGFDVTDLRALGLTHLDDPAIVEIAKQTGRVIVSFDLDFAELFRQDQHGRFGVIILRLGVQTPPMVNRALGRFFADPDTEAIPLERSLVMLDEVRSRVTTVP